MPLVSETQLTTLRARAYQGLTSTAHILRPIQVETDFGSEEAYATVALDEPCWIRATAVPAIVTEEAMRVVTAGVFRCHFRVGTDLEPGDQVIVNDQPFDVVDTNNENTVRIFTTVMARRLE